MSLIPYLLPPLHRLRVLVTRPEPQATRLATAIQAHGGEPLIFPSIEIRPVGTSLTVNVGDYHWIVFLSVHAVEHSTTCLTCASGPRVAAVGHATALSLKERSWDVHLVPTTLQSTEGLLAHPDFTVQAGDRVLVVRGAAGRTDLDAALTARGAHVESLTVYERVAKTHSPQAIALLEREWEDAGIDVVTATSADTLVQLHATLTERGRQLLSQTPLAVVSARVAARARELGLAGDCIVTHTADDAAIVGALSNWLARAR